MGEYKPGEVLVLLKDEVPPEQIDALLTNVGLGDYRVKRVESGDIRILQLFVTPGTEHQWIARLENEPLVKAAFPHYKRKLTTGKFTYSDYGMHIELDFQDNEWRAEQFARYMETYDMKDPYTLCNISEWAKNRGIPCRIRFGPWWRPDKYFAMWLMNVLYKYPAMKKKFPPSKLP